jgi:mevalonate kinase
LLGELPLLLANTGVQRHSGTVHKGFRERWLEGDPEVVDGYRRAARLAREAKKAMLAGDWACVGEAMNQNHAIQRDLGGSGEANERLIAAALQAGALGAKLAGAGKGGTIIALHDDLDHLAKKLEEAGAARVLRVTPSEGLVVEGQI